MWYRVASMCLYGCCFLKSFSLWARVRAYMKDLYAGFMGPRHRIALWQYKKLRVCVWRVSGWLVRFWGSCLIIYLYNLQKKGLVERRGCLLQATLGILQVKSCFSSYQHNSLSEKVMKSDEWTQHTVLDGLFIDSYSMLYQSTVCLIIFNTKSPLGVHDALFKFASSLDLTENPIHFLFFL